MNHSKSSVFSIFLIIATISIVIAICGLVFRTFGDRNVIESFTIGDSSDIYPSTQVVSHGSSPPIISSFDANTGNYSSDCSGVGMYPVCPCNRNFKFAFRYSDGSFSLAGGDVNGNGINATDCSPTGGYFNPTIVFSISKIDKAAKQMYLLNSPVESDNYVFSNVAPLDITSYSGSLPLTFSGKTAENTNPPIPFAPTTPPPTNLTFQKFDNTNCVDSRIPSPGASGDGYKYLGIFNSYEECAKSGNIPPDAKAITYHDASIPGYANQCYSINDNNTNTAGQTYATCGVVVPKPAPKPAPKPVPKPAPKPVPKPAEKHMFGLSNKSNTANKCNDPNFRSSDKQDGGNCRRVCVPTNADGTPRYKDKNGNIDTSRVYGDPFNAMDPNQQPVDQWTSNYFYYNDEFSPITDKSLSCVKPGTDCTQAFACNPDQPSAQGKCTKVTRADEISCKLIEADKKDPTSKSRIQCYPCPMIDGKLDCSQWEQCKDRTDLIVNFSPDWSPPSHKSSDKPYTQSECRTNCLNPRNDPFPMAAFKYFLKLNDEGDDGLTTSTCRKIGRNIIECDPISKTSTPSGVLPSLSECAICKDPSLKWYARYRVTGEDKNGKKYEITPLKGDPRIGGGGSGGGGGGSRQRSGRGASYGPDDGDMSRGSKYSPSQYGGGMRDAGEMGKMISTNNQKSKSIEIAKQNSSNEQQNALASSLKIELDKINTEYTNASNVVKSNKAKIDTTTTACTDANNKLSAFKSSQSSKQGMGAGTGSGVSIKDKVNAGANASMMSTLTQASATACKASSDAKIAYQKSVDDMKAISDKREKAVTQLMTVLESITENKTTININVGGMGGGMGGGRNANNDCYGIMGCGSGIDNFYPFPNNRDRQHFNRRTPMPYTDMINF